MHEIIIGRRECGYFAYPYFCRSLNLVELKMLLNGEKKKKNHKELI